MNTLAMSLPLLLAPVLYAALVKIAALILRRIQLSWKHALLFGLLAMAVGAVTTFANFATGRIVPVPLAVLLGVAIQLAIGGWYLKDRAQLASGAPIGLVRGALLPLVAIAIVFAVVVAVSFFTPAP